MTRAPALVAWVVLAVACGPVEPTSKAKFETFTITLEEVAPGAELAPLTRLQYRVVYRGDLARNLRVVATITELGSGESVTQNLASAQSQDDATIDQRGSWVIDHDFLKRAGRFEVKLTASIAATLRNSPTWTTTSETVTIRTAPHIDRVAVTPASATAPTPYGTPMVVTVEGGGLWDDVVLSVDNLDSNLAVPGLARSLPFTADKASMSSSWALTAPSLERIAVHHLQLVATFGHVVARSEPFAIEVTYTLDSVVLEVRDANGALVTTPTGEVRMDRAKDFHLQISGTKLAGHEVQLNAEPPFVAPADSFELVREPKLSDFEDGKGRKRYEFVARAGGMERSDDVLVRRWGIDGRGWWKDATTPITNGQVVSPGTTVTLRVTGWGLPDTQGILIFKTHQAHFKIWERDYGQNTTNLPQPFVNNDDEVATLDGDVRSSQGEQTWKTKFEEEVDFLNLNRAEYYFEVRVEDELCVSADMVVPPM